MARCWIAGTQPAPRMPHDSISACNATRVLGRPDNEAMPKAMCTMPHESLIGAAEVLNDQIVKRIAFSGIGQDRNTVQLVSIRIATRSQSDVYG